MCLSVIKINNKPEAELPLNNNNTMSAKSDHIIEPNLTNIQTYEPKLPQIDNSDFNDTTNELSRSVIKAETSLDQVSIFSSVSDIEDKHEVITDGKTCSEKVEDTVQKNNELTTKIYTIEMEKSSDDYQEKSADVDLESETRLSGKNLESVHSLEINRMNISNSLYDSNEKLVFYRSTSDYSENETEPTNVFWKNLLLLSMLPYTVTGVPVISIIQLSQQHLLMTSAKQWFKFMFSSPFTIVTNSIELCVVMMLNLYITYSFVGPLYALIGYGQVSERLIVLLVHLYEMIPLLIGLNLVWPKGYTLSNIVRVLDSPVYFRELKQSKVKLYNGIFKMAATYICLVMCTVGSFVSFEWKNSYSYQTEYQSVFYYRLVIHFFLMLIIPVYLTIISVSDQKRLQLL